MLSDVLHIVSKLQGSLQVKNIDLDSVPGMVENMLKEVKENSKRATWFKGHYLVFSDPTQHEKG